MSAIILFTRSGERQNSRKASVEYGLVFMPLDEGALERCINSPREPMPISFTAPIASAMAAGPIRKSRPPEGTGEEDDIIGRAFHHSHGLRRSSCSVLRQQFGLHLGKQAAAFGTFDPGDVVLIFEKRPQRIGHRLGIERQRVELRECRGPVDRFRDAGVLEEVERLNL